MEQLLGLLGKPFIHGPGPAALGHGLLALDVYRHHQLRQIPAAACANQLLIVPGEQLQRGGVVGGGMDGGDLVNEGFRLLGGDHRADGDLGLIRRRVDDAVLMQGPQLVIGPLLLSRGRLGTGDSLYPAHAGGAVDHQIAWLKHDTSSLSKPDYFQC